MKGTPKKGTPSRGFEHVMNCLVHPKLFILGRWPLTHQSNSCTVQTLVDWRWLWKTMKTSAWRFFPGMNRVMDWMRYTPWCQVVFGCLVYWSCFFVFRGGVFRCWIFVPWRTGAERNRRTGLMCEKLKVQTFGGSCVLVLQAFTVLINGICYETTTADWKLQQGI